MDATVAATVLPLIGVALGTAGTLTGQYLATRGEARRHADLRTAQSRAERKEAIVGYLDAVQRVERVVDNRLRGRAAPDDAVDDALHALWLAKKLTELVCGNDLASAAHAYTSTLDDLARSAAPGRPSAGQRGRRGDFMEAARRELGIPGPRLYPGTAD